MRSVVFIFAFLSLAFAKNEYYNGFSLYEVTVNTVDQVKLVNDLENQLGLDVWSHALPGRVGEILVSKDKKSQFENVLKTNGVNYKIETENIQELIYLEERMLAQASQKASMESRAVSYDRIYTYDEVNEFLHDLAEKYPSLVTLVNGGKSFEGRDTFYIKISTTNFEDQSKPIIFMESLIHAREWVTLPTTLYAIEKLVIDVTDTDVAQNIDWIILPIANPDGYVFTHTNERFWRKNRATGYHNTCLGVDLNRNFDIAFGTASSNNVCSETFHGRAGFSEPETAIIRDIFEEYRGRINTFLDIHSYGSMILYGWGTGVLPSNGLYVHLLGVTMGDAIDAVKLSYKPNYRVGNSALILYGTSGSAQDYGQLVANYSYTFELPQWRFGGGLNGFLVDPDFIEQAGFETWEGIKAGARYIISNYRPNKLSIDKEQASLVQARRKSYNASQIGLPIDRIYTYEEVDTYLETLASAYPQTVTLVNAGKSFEGRDIKYLKISTTNFQDNSKPIVFLESLLHAREWITLPVTLYAIEKLVIDITEQDLLQDIDWVILPIVNPDGYIFTHTDNRFWRKNRATGYIINDICRGVDLNRNFEFNWSRSFSSSFIPCSLNFHGSGPLSEPETVIVNNILEEYSQNGRLQLFIDVHSYGSEVFYGYGNLTLPPNGLWLHLVGVNMAQAIDAVKVPENPNYIVGNIAAIISVTVSGLAQDQGLLKGVPFSYTFELPAYRPGVDNDDGFLVDPDFIAQGAFETWEGIKVGARYVRNNYRARN